jgi:hypothetical protein
VAVFSKVVTFPITRLGGVGTIVSVKEEVLVRLAELPTAMVTVTTLVVKPKPEAGVMVTVRLDPLPPKVLLAIRLGFENVTARVREPSGVKASPMVNGIAALGTPSEPVWFAMAEIVGGVGGVTTT